MIVEFIKPDERGLDSADEQGETRTGVLVRVNART
jgi:hypothetical protein